MLGYHQLRIHAVKAEYIERMDSENAKHGVHSRVYYFNFGAHAVS
jgi:hypothetical protein